LHALAYAINKQEKLVRVKSLTDSFDFRALEPSLQSASIVKFIHETYGITTLKNFWKNGLYNVHSILGISVDEFESRWMKHIEQENIAQM
jgi:hypothetical protein